MLASGGERLRRLLNILRCTGEPPTSKNYLNRNGKSADVKKSCHREKCLLNISVRVELGSSIQRWLKLRLRVK